MYEAYFRHNPRSRALLIGALGVAVMATGIVTVAVRSVDGSKMPGPTASATGMFAPRLTAEQAAGLPARLITRTASLPTTLEYTFVVHAPKYDSITFMSDCDHGRGTLEIGGGVSDMRCSGKPHGVITLCSGGTVMFTASVSEPQRTRWGVAAYVSIPSPHSC